MGISFVDCAGSFVGAFVDVDAASVGFDDVVVGFRGGGGRIIVCVHARVESSLGIQGITDRARIRKEFFCDDSHRRAVRIRVASVSAGSWCVEC